MDFGDPTVWRGVERLLITIGAILFGVLGYKLYQLGFTKPAGTVKVESKLLQFVLSGTGPGIAFMAFAALVLASALVTGGAAVRGGTNGTNTKEAVGRTAQITEKYLYSLPVDSCARLVGSPDEALPSALRTSDMAWAPRLAERISDVKTLRAVVDAVCAP
jgi:hypothetical protein